MNKQLVQLLVLLFLVAVIVCVSYFNNSFRVPFSSEETHLAVAIHREIKYQFALITPMQYATEISYSSENKVLSVSVCAYYITDSTHEEIFDYYDNALQGNGWKPLYGAEDSGTFYGQYGGKIDRYEKDDLIAALLYGDENSDVEWIYGLCMTWDSMLEQ